MAMLYCCSEFRFQPDQEVIPYVLDVRQVPGAGLVTLTSDAQVCIFDPNRLGLGPVAMLYCPHGGDTFPSMRAFDMAVIATAGGDGFVNLWDLRILSATPVSRLYGSPAPICSLACDRGTHSIAAGTELHDGLAATVVWDVRATTEPVQLLGLHSEDVTDVVFDPLARSHLISGSVDGLVLTTDTLVIDEDDALLDTFNMGAPIHRAVRLQSDAILALSQDEKLAIFGPGVVENFGDVRPQLKCRYVCDAQPQVGGHGAILGIGNTSYNSFQLLNLSQSFSDERWDFDPASRCRLIGAHGDDIVRAFCCVGNRDAVFTVGEDGWVRAWRQDELRWRDRRRA